jgi:hypothetical protein
MELLLSKIALKTVGIDVSRHLFRTGGASTGAVYGGEHPHLANVLLGHIVARMSVVI